jgi:hypothetical protein
LERVEDPKLGVGWGMVGARVGVAGRSRMPAKIRRPVGLTARFSG